MPKEMNVEVRITDWQHARDDARAIRTEVFIQEQKVPEEMEWDDDDLTAVHFVLYDKGTPAGCARLLPDGHFGRMAVRREWRRSGAGSVLLQSLIQYAFGQGNMDILRASAQTKALLFYHSNGFSADGGFYADADMPHVHIHRERKKLPASDYLMPAKDATVHTLDTVIAQMGWLEIALSGNPYHVTLICGTPQYALWSAQAVIDAISQYVRAETSHGPRLTIVFPADIKGMERHPLVVLQQRLSSLIEIRIQPRIGRHTLLLAEPWGVMHFSDEDHALGELNNPAKVEHLKMEMKEMLEHSHAPHSSPQIML